MQTEGLTTVAEKVGQIARNMGLSFICESWVRANRALDKFHRVGADRHVSADDNTSLPVCLYIQPVAGSFVFTSADYVKDSPSCFISFADAMPLDYTGEQAQEIAERLKVLAVDFIAALNASGYFEPIYGNIPYKVAFDRLDACLCIVSITPTITEIVGKCIEED